LLQPPRHGDMWSNTGAPAPSATANRVAGRAAFHPGLKGIGTKAALGPGMPRLEKRDVQAKAFGVPGLAGRADAAPAAAKGARMGGPAQQQQGQMASALAARSGLPGQGPGAEVAAFLKELGMAQYAEQLISNGFDDMDTLVHIEDADMRELGLPAIHVVKLRRRLQELWRQQDPELDEGNMVVAFLKDIGLSQYAKALLQSGFDELDVLLDIEDADMRDLGIPRGHAVKLKRRLREYQRPEDFRQDFPRQPAKAKPSGNPRFSSGGAVQACGNMPNDEMRTAVARSWEEVQALGTYAVAELLYRHTFELEPEAIDLFPPDVRYKYRDWTADEGADESDVYDSPALRKLFSKYMNAVGCTVAGLNDFAQLVPMLRALGARHISYGVSERHWPLLGRALMLTLRDVLGETFSPEVESAWTMVYGFMSSIMIEGLRSAIAARSQASGSGGSPPPSVKTAGSEHQDDDVRSQDSLTTGLPSTSVASMDTWQRQASSLSEDGLKDETHVLRPL